MSNLRDCLKPNFSPDTFCAFSFHSDWTFSSISPSFSLLPRSTEDKESKHDINCNSKRELFVCEAFPVCPGPSLLRDEVNNRWLKLFVLNRVEEKVSMQSRLQGLVVGGVTLRFRFARPAKIRPSCRKRSWFPWASCTSPAWPEARRRWP